MKLSIFNKKVQYQNGYLLFNSVSGCLIKLSNKLADGLVSENLHTINNDLLIKLKKLGFIVNKEDDEKLILKKKFEEKTNSHLSKFLYITTTDRCNLGCHYCFEEKNQWIKMSDETQLALINFSKKFLSQTRTDFFGVSWYGGEPTMHMPAVVNLSNFYSKFCEENKIHFDQMIVTNGTTLTDRICETLIKLGIKKAQITIDGIKEDHDISRPFLKDLTIDQMSEAQKNQIKKINPSLLLNVLNDQPKKENIVTRSSFDQIIKGLETYVAKGGEVSLRMNVNADTVEKTTKLLDDLYKKDLFFKNKNGGFLYAYAQAIYDIGSCGNSTGCSACPVSAMRVSEFANKVEILKDWYKEKQIKWFDHTSEMRFTGDTCTANKKYEYVVNPDGTLTKCTHDVGKPDKVIGSVFDENPDPDKMRISNTAYDRFNPFEDKECSSCEVLPICLGGCKSNNKVGLSDKYEAGCNTIKYSYERDIIRLYEKNKS
jgi:uncharacterized protein